MGILKKLFGGVPKVAPAYMFNPVGIPLPGQAYHAPLLKYNDDPQNMVQGRGALVMQPFRPYAPQFDTTVLNPVQGATIGTLTGSLWFQPLTDASIGNVG